MSKSILFYISIILLVSSILLIAANNIPILLSYRWLWAPMFLLFSLFFYSKVLLHKSVRNALLYGLLYAGLLQYTLWSHANDWYKKAIFEDFYALIVPVILFAILNRYKYFKEWQKLAKLGVIFFIITGIMTIIATFKNPFVVRASYSSQQFEIPNYDALFRLGFGSYGYMTALVSFLPILVYYFKNNVYFWLSRKALIILIIFFYVVLIRSQITANIIVATIILILAYFGSEKFKRNIIIISIISIIIFAVPRHFWAKQILHISSLFSPESLLNNRLKDLASYIINPEFTETGAKTQVGTRFARYPMLLKAFIANPFFGDANYESPFSYELKVGGHLYWMSRLTLWGIFGFIGYIFLLKNIFTPIIKIFNSDFKFYYLLSLLSIIALGFMKNIAGREPYIMLFIIIPGLYFYQILNLNKQKFNNQKKKS